VCEGPRRFEQGLLERSGAVQETVVRGFVAMAFPPPEPSLRQVPPD
jgi:hypothetical protein